MTHEFPVRVYYEDTDLAGVVYYANYLRFIERARSDWVRGLGIDQKAMKSEQGVVFAVRRVEADYILPARFDEEIVVKTVPQSISGARLVLKQDVFRETDLLFSALVTIVCIADSGQPARLPANIRLMLH